MQPYLFLLGGHDLEMTTIRTLLDEYQQAFIDRNLAWGASWQDYQDIVDSFDRGAQTLVGIELSGPTPPDALLIDHHNERIHLPSSLEQLATLLGITLTRQQLLIAANDTGYIPIMQQAGATEEEIRKIRRLDRQAQGVTEAMEEQAEHDIRLVNTINNVTIIYTNLSKFSPIADRIQVPQLLIYNSSELTYYGLRASELVTVFTDDVKAGRTYYGGGPNGYFGVGAGHYELKEIKQFVEKICTYFIKVL